MRIAICEDETHHIRTLVKIVTEWADIVQIHVEIRTYLSGEDFIEGFRTEEKFDLLLLDMQMRRVSGLDVAKTVRQADKNIVIIFVTGFIDYVLGGYEVKALRYLTKPLNREDCYLALDKALEAVNDRKEGLFFITDNGRSTRVFLNDIYYFSFGGRVISAHASSGIFQFKDQIAELEKRLPSPNFCRCARCFIVNISHVNLINRDRVMLDNNEVLPVAHTRWPALNEAFMEYHNRQ